MLFTFCENDVFTVAVAAACEVELVGELELCTSLLGMSSRSGYWAASYE